MAFIPGWLVSIATFPGVIVHEYGHEWFCRLFGVPVHEVVYFQFGTPAGYVRHGEPSSYQATFMVSVGPFVMNTAVAAAVFAATAVLPQGVLRGVAMWLGLSIGMHAFPSKGDARQLWAASKRHWRDRPLALAGFPIVALIYLANLLSFLWFDLIYAAGLYVTVTNPAVVAFAVTNPGLLAALLSPTPDDTATGVDASGLPEVTVQSYDLPGTREERDGVVHLGPGYELAGSSWDRDGDTASYRTRFRLTAKELEQPETVTARLTQYRSPDAAAAAVDDIRRKPRAAQRYLRTGARAVEARDDEAGSRVCSLTGRDHALVFTVETRDPDQRFCALARRLFTAVQARAASGRHGKQGRVLRTLHELTLSLHTVSGMRFDGAAADYNMTVGVGAWRNMSTGYARTRMAQAQLLEKKTRIFWKHGTNPVAAPLTITSTAHRYETADAAATAVNELRTTVTAEDGNATVHDIITGHPVTRIKTVRGPYRVVWLVDQQGTRIYGVRTVHTDRFPVDAAERLLLQVMVEALEQGR